MVMLTHITNLGWAINIIQSRVFIPLSQFPGKGDTGMNCFAEGREYTNANHYEGSGCDLIFEWTGNVTDDTNMMLQPNWLCHHGGWRSVVTKGTNTGLTATDIKVTSSDEWVSLLKKAPWYILRKRRYMEAQAKELEERIRRQLRKGVPIRIS